MSALQIIGDCIASAEKILEEMKAALLADRSGKTPPLRQSTEFALVTAQADYESAAALLDEAKARVSAARLAALSKNAEFLLQRLAGVIVSLTVEEPLFRSYERAGENLAALAKSAASLREASGAAATEEIMSALGIDSAT